MNDLVMRKNLVELINGGQAHLTLDEALQGLNPQRRNVRPPNGPHSVWEELEHMRIAQEDILRYSFDAKWVSPEFPGEYWPVDPAGMTEAAWSATLSGFRRNLEEVKKWVMDADRDLTVQIPHGEGRTYLRQVLLVADHNAYHLGQIVQIRKALGDWPH